MLVCCWVLGRCRRLIRRRPRRHPVRRRSARTPTADQRQSDTGKEWPYQAIGSPRHHRPIDPDTHDGNSRRGVRAARLGLQELDQQRDGRVQFAAVVAARRCPAGRGGPRCARSSMDRASVYGTESDSSQVVNSKEDTQLSSSDNSAYCSARPPKQAQGTPETPADLAEVVASWPDLPEAVKAGIVAMVKAACSPASAGGKGTE